MTTPPTPPSPPQVGYFRNAADYVPSADDRTMSLLIHLGLIFAPVLSLIIWLIKREMSPFVEHHGKQALAFFIATIIAAVIIVPLCFFCVGFFLLPVYLILHIVLPILAGVAANRGEWYRYPAVGGMFS